MDDDRDQTDQQRHRGCHGRAQSPFGFAGEELDRCPVKSVRWAQVRPILSLWSHLTAGRMPCLGGYADQPALWVDVLAVIDELNRPEPRDRG